MEQPMHEVAITPTKKDKPLRRSTYYNEASAVELAFLLRLIVKDNESKLIPYDAIKLRPQSFIQKIHHSWAWIIDHPDPEEWKTKITKEEIKELIDIKSKIKLQPLSSGMMFEYKKIRETLYTDIAQSVKADEGNELFEQIVEFLRTAKPGEVYKSTGIIVSDPFRSRINSVIAASPKFVANVTSNSIKIVRIKDEDPGVA